MGSPIDKFFAMGDKATKGDPYKKAKFDYYLLWIMFFAFFSILVSNFQAFWVTASVSIWGSLKYLGWSGVMCAILWFQYFGLKQARQGMLVMKQFKNVKPEPAKKEEIESVENMLKGFK